MVKNYLIFVTRPIRFLALCILLLATKIFMLSLMYKTLHVFALSKSNSESMSHDIYEVLRALEAL